MYSWRRRLCQIGLRVPFRGFLIIRYSLVFLSIPLLTQNNPLELRYVMLVRMIPRTNLTAYLEVL